jgi:hypothetical protein
MEEEIGFEQLVSRGCGLDVHKKEIVATIRGTGLRKQTPQFWRNDAFFDRIKRLVIRE